jgi:hypothetical protein
VCQYDGQRGKGVVRDALFVVDEPGRRPVAVAELTKDRELVRELLRAQRAADLEGMVAAGAVLLNPLDGLVRLAEAVLAVGLREPLAEGEKTVDELLLRSLPRRGRALGRVLRGSVGLGSGRLVGSGLLGLALDLRPTGRIHDCNDYVDDKDE